MPFNANGIFRRLLTKRLITKGALPLSFVLIAMAILWVAIPLSAAQESVFYIHWENNTVRMDQGYFMEVRYSPDASNPPKQPRSEIELIDEPAGAVEVILSSRTIEFPQDRISLKPPALQRIKFIPRSRQRSALINLQFVDRSGTVLGKKPVQFNVV